MTTTAVKERPILFSGPMIRAILDGRKTQTRRVIDRMAGFQVKHFDRSNTPGYDWHFRCQRGMWQDMDHAEVLSRCPYGQSGDRLWVRETHAIYTDEMVRDKGEEVVLFKADSSAYWNMNPHKPMEAEFNPLRDEADYEPKWRPSIHMPRWASRITLEITGVRVERLQDISDADAMAEGCNAKIPDGFPCAVAWFHNLWQSINGPNSWAANPYVWVIEFKRCEQ